MVRPFSCDFVNKPLYTTIVGRHKHYEQYIESISCPTYYVRFEAKSNLGVMLDIACATSWNIFFALFTPVRGFANWASSLAFDESVAHYDASTVASIYR